MLENCSLSFLCLSPLLETHLQAGLPPAKPTGPTRPSCPSRAGRQISCCPDLALTSQAWGCAVVSCHCNPGNQARLGASTSAVHTAGRCHGQGWGTLTGQELGSGSTRPAPGGKRRGKSTWRASSGASGQPLWAPCSYPLCEDQETRDTESPSAVDRLLSSGTAVTAAQSRTFCP